MFSFNQKPTYGDQIRVNRGLYYHHGIYIDDDNIVQFGSPTNELNPATARVMIVSLKQFLNNGTVETRVLSNEEKKTVRKPQEVVNYALSQLGVGGYNLLTNNCEHFANDCLFGKRESQQTNSVLNFLDKLTKL